LQTFLYNFFLSIIGVFYQSPKPELSIIIVSADALEGSS